MRRLTCTAFLILIHLLTTGCANKDVRFPPSTDIVMKDAMDNLSSRHAQSEVKAESLVLMTLTQSTYEDLRNRSNINDGQVRGPYGEFLAELDDGYGLRRVADWPLASLGVRCLVFESASRLDTDHIISALKNDPRIETVQAVSEYQVLAEEYNDPYLDLQGGLQLMQVPPSHDWATGRQISVAVIDTGVDITHPELKDNIGGSRNFVDKDIAAFNSDVHGTAIAGVIAASANNGVGIVGVAPNAKVLAFKACWQKAPGFVGAVCSSFTLAKALNFSIGKKVDIINLSLSGPSDPLLERLVRKALEEDIVVVGAVHPERSTDFPASVDGVISVDDTRRKPGENNPAVVRAPGYQVISTRPEGDFDFYSGSSLSTAHVSGLIALLKERRSHISPMEVLMLLKDTSSRVRSVEVGRGMVNACMALAKLVLPHSYTSECSDAQ